MARKSWHSLPEYQTLRAMMEGNTTASAARRLGLSQSAISRSISSLEGRIGRTLFERLGGRLIPTAAAVELNSRLDPLFEALDNIDRPAQSVDETLRMVAPPSFAGSFLTTHIAAFVRTNPGYFLNLEIATSEDVIAGLQDNRFDLGIIGVELTRTGAKLIPFRRAQAVVAMPADHPLARQKSIIPADLHGENLVAYTYRHARRAQLDKLLHEANARVRVIAEVSASSTALDLVRAGLGVAVINPFPAMLEPLKGLVFRPFASVMTYQIYFAAPDNRPLSRAARHFMQHIRLHTPDDIYSTTLR